MAGQYQRAEFLKSVPTLAGSPADSGAEVAFAGRSNAGKSSALNLITGIRALARTSKTPGRTQHLVFFGLDEERRLVDLPGYGYAKVPERLKHQWQHTMEEYLRRRQSLRGLVLVMDIRHPLTDYDRQMLEWVRHDGLAVHILLSKADKLSRGAAAGVLQQVRRELTPNMSEVSVQIFSALKRTGAEEARAVLDRWLGYPAPGEEEAV